MSGHRPFVPCEVVQGRLVRVCPDCQQAIVERTDDDGVVSDRFTEHWEAEHRKDPEPERPRFYVLPIRGLGNAQVRRNLSHQALASMRKHHPDTDWTLVDQVEDLPEGVPAVLSGDVLSRIFDEDGGSIPLCQRQGDELVPIPMPEEERQLWLAEYTERSDELRERRLAANQVLVARREHRLPQFRKPKNSEGEAVIAAWESWRERRRPLEAKITSKLDEANERSWRRVWNRRSDWRDPLDEAIVAAGISEDEIKDVIEAQQAAEQRWREASDE